MKSNTIRKLLTVALTGVILTGSLAGCGSGASTDGSKDVKTTSTEANSDLNKATTLNVAYQTGYYPVFIMEKEKTLDKALKDAGYDVKVTYNLFESGPPENESFASGQQDVGFIGNVPGVSGIASGQDRKVIGVALSGAKSNGVLVKKGSSIKSVADLKGKKVGLVIGSCSENLLYNLLQKENIAYDDVNRVNLSPAEQVSALSSGQVDAIVSWDPTMTTLINAGDATLIADGENGMLGSDPIVADGKYVKENPDIVRIFLEEYKKAEKEVEDNNEEVAEKYADAAGIKKDDFLVMLKSTEFPDELTEDDVKDLQGTADFLKETGLINKSVTVSDYVVTDLDKKATEEVGK